jgi:hypothetical protein
MKSIDEINQGHMPPLPTPQPVVFSPQLMRLFERLVVAAERYTNIYEQYMEMCKESREESRNGSDADAYAKALESQRAQRRRHILARDDDPPERAAELQAKTDALHDAIDELNRKYSRGDGRQE